MWFCGVVAKLREFLVDLTVVDRKSTYDFACLLPCGYGKQGEVKKTG
jgi:hypothetical protein